MRTRACVAASVVEADRFLGLSLESQVLYLHCLLSADVTGRILGARRLARGYGLSDALDELVGEGYLIDVDGVVFDRFAWVNNRFNGQHFARMEDCEEYADGRLYFEGIEGKSAYGTTAPQMSDSGVTTECQSVDNEVTIECHSHDNRFDTKQDKATTTTTATQSQFQMQSNSPSFSLAETEQADKGKEGNTHPCMCRKCGSTSATYSVTEEGTLISCPSCGVYAY